MFQAVIFDCDGVLVDSEVLFHAVELEVLAEFGLVYDSRAFKARFLGLSDEAYYVALDSDAKERLGHSIIAELRPRMHAKVLARFDRDLTAVAGALAAVEAVPLPKAVASSSGVKSLETKLKRFGLWDPFVPHVYSAELVARAKPAPDIFLHSAAQLNVPPAACLVIEDSVNGVKAALAAGMTVWGFSGGGHMDASLAALLTEAGATRLLADWQEAHGVFAGF